MSDTPGLPTIRWSPDHKYQIISPGVESDDFKYDNPVALETSTTGLALESGTNRFVTKTLPPGPIGDVTGPPVATDNAIARYDGTTGKLIQNSVVLISDVGGITGATSLNGSPIPNPIGDVVGPAGATDNAVARFDGVTGKLIQNGVVLISDAGAITNVTTINGSTVPNPIGDVVGPAGAVNGRIAIYSGATGKLIADSGSTIGAGSSIGAGVGVGAGTVIGTGVNIANGANLSGVNTGDVSFAAFGAAPNASGASVAVNQVVTLQPASATEPGGVSTAAQSYAGIKNFTSGAQFGNVPASPLGGGQVLDYFDDAGPMAGSSVAAIVLSTSSSTGSGSPAWDICRIGRMLFYNIGEFLVAGDGGAPGPFLSQINPAPATLFPAGNPRSALIPVVAANVVTTGLLIATPPANQIQIYASPAQAGFPIGAFSNGIPAGGITAVVRT